MDKINRCLGRRHYHITTIDGRYHRAAAMLARNRQRAIPPAFHNIAFVCSLNDSSKLRPLLGSDSLRYHLHTVRGRRALRTTLRLIRSTTVDPTNLRLMILTILYILTGRRP